MKLISCDIENFGKISNAHFGFTDGCNIICESNGWGKSTLATFIRVMFFGFENPNSRDELSNERKKFTPWQGGVYGGKIHFEANGCEYIISRTFGAKEREDKFSLRNALTNLETNDFTSNIGIELFHIDGKSFARTVYISQNDCDTEFTDSINAKLGNLAEHMDDINNFEKVDKSLKDLLNKMSPSKSRGALYRMKSEIAQREQCIRQMSAIENSMQEITDIQNKNKIRYQSLKQQQEQLQSDKLILSKVKDNQLLCEKYNNLVSDYEIKKDRLAQSESFFNGDVPTKESLSDYTKKISEIIHYENEIARNRMSDSEFEELNRYKKVFANNVPEDVRINEMISNWNIRSEKKNTLALKKENLEFKRSMVRSTPVEKRKNPALVFIGLLFIIVGIVIFILNKIVGGIVLGIGLTIFVAGIILYSVIKPVECVENYDFTPEENEISIIEEYLIKVEKSVREFMSEFELEYEEYSVPVVLNDFKKNISRYTYLLEKEKENELLENDEEMNNLRKKVDAFIYKYYNKRYNTGEMPKIIYELESRLNHYTECKSEYDKAVELKSSFENSSQYSQINDLKNMDASRMENIGNVGIFEELKDIEDIDITLNGIASDIEKIHKNILDYSVKLEKLQDEYDELSIKVEYLNELMETYNAEYKRYGLIEKTREHLANAKVSFTCKYTNGITKGFNKYYSMIANEMTDKYFLDAEGNVTVEEKGLQRDKRYLSAGKRDIVGICMRMALVDAMYEGEKPFVIFDDPFVNLDKDKVNGGLDLLKDISKEYQVIYFTCHDSRR